MDEYTSRIVYLASALVIAPFAILCLFMVFGATVICNIIIDQLLSR